MFVERYKIEDQHVMQFLTFTAIGKCLRDFIIEIMLSNIISGKFLVICIFFLFNDSIAIGQLTASYKNNIYACNCISVVLKNNSPDTIYAIAQSYSIQYWDSCFAYSIFQANPPQNGYNLNITYYYRDLDDYHHNIIYLFPDSTLMFGARSRNEMISDSLFISMYISTVSVQNGATMTNMKSALGKMKKRQKRVPWEWRNYFCCPR